MTQLESITAVLPLPITRVIHLREDLFLVGYGAGIIELRDFKRVNGGPDEASKAIKSFSADVIFEDE